MWSVYFWLRPNGRAVVFVCSVVNSFESARRQKRVAIQNPRARCSFLKRDAHHEHLGLPV